MSAVTTGQLLTDTEYCSVNSQHRISSGMSGQLKNEPKLHKKNT